MAVHIKKPEVTVKEQYKHEKQETLNHDAFGIVRLSVHTGGHNALFGSDLNHNQCVCIEICRAETTRNLSNDWIHAESVPIVAVNMSHSQFAEFIMSGGNYSGTPCTLTYAPARGTQTEQMPGIDKIESKAETFRREIKASTKEQMAKLMDSIEQLGKMIEEGKTSKKDLKALQFNMKCVAQNTAENLPFVVQQAEEALEKAVSHSRNEIEAYINHAANRLGLEAAKGLGIISDTKVVELLPDGTEKVICS